MENVKRRIPGYALFVFFLTLLSFAVRAESKTKNVPSPNVQMELPCLKDTVVSDDTGIGTDAFMGTCIGYNQLEDEKLTALVKKHFNSVTLEKELKPAALLAGGNADLVDDETFGVVPKTLDFTKADEMLDRILMWNDKEGTRIKVRGHVLTWHSGTPSWVFREGDTEEGAYVSPEVMSARHEWYIKTVLEHYFSEDSRYKNLFYGFDVLNEACSDSSAGYRSEKEKSEWAAVYGTGSEDDAPDYVLNAFRFANKYAPQTLELYYNDYNECQRTKALAIEKLLMSVKKHEDDEQNPTRLTAFGMQAHYSLNSPMKERFLECAVRYGSIVGKIQITELDIKVSRDNGSTADAQAEEYTRMAYRYKDIFDACREVDQIPGTDVNVFSVWGAIDSVSWLNAADSDDSGSDAGRKQFPLLFDENYQAKPAFWGIVDAGKLDPREKNVTVLPKSDGDSPYEFGWSYTFDEINASFIPVWDAEGISVKLDIGEDVAVREIDFYVNRTGDPSSRPELSVILGNDTGCYYLETEKERTEAADDITETTFLFDIVIVLDDAAGTRIAYNNKKLTHDKDSRFFASGVFKPIIKIPKGTIYPDGKIEEAWSLTEDAALSAKTGSPKASAAVRLLWDENYLYVLMNVTDQNRDASSELSHEKDSVEIFIDENNEKSGSYQQDDKQYRINYKGEISFHGLKSIGENVKYAVKETDTGYLLEAAFAWTDLVPGAGRKIGIDFQINDCEDSKRIGTLNWFDTSGNAGRALHGSFRALYEE